jgi:hypothetical protein
MMHAVMRVRADGKDIKDFKKVVLLLETATARRKVVVVQHHFVIICSCTCLPLKQNVSLRSI